MSIPIEAPPESPGHVGHTPQPWINLGLRLGRFHDWGGLYGSGVVRALLGQPQSPGVLPVAPPVEYALQPFGVPGRADGRTRPPTPREAAASHAHTVLALEEAAYQYGRGGGRQRMPEALAAALADFRTWRSPR